MNHYNLSSLNGDIFPLRDIRYACLFPKGEYSSIIFHVCFLIRWGFQLSEINLFYNSRDKNLPEFVFLKNLIVNGKRISFLDEEEYNLNDVITFLKQKFQECSLYIGIFNPFDNDEDIQREIDMMPKLYNTLIFYNTKWDFSFEQTHAKIYHLSLFDEENIEYDLTNIIYFLEKIDEEWSINTMKFLKNKENIIDPLTSALCDVIFEKSIVTPLLAIDVNNMMRDFDDIKVETPPELKNDKSQTFGSVLLFLTIFAIFIFSIISFIAVKQFYKPNPMEINNFNTLSLIHQ